MQQVLREYFQFRVPRGFHDALMAVAEREGTTASAFARRAILSDIEERRERSERDEDEGEQR